jgi:hypothetical protein
MKTAVEWLFNQLSINNMALDKGTKVHQEMEQKILEKAKEMEKKHIVNAHFNGCGIGEIFAYENREFITDSEQYYNETFKQ